MVNEPARVTQHLRPRAWIQAGRPSLLHKETECQAAKGGGRARVAPSGARTPRWGQQGREWQRGWSRGQGAWPLHCRSFPQGGALQQASKLGTPACAASPGRWPADLGVSTWGLGSAASLPKSQGSYPDPPSVGNTRSPRPQAGTSCHLAFIPTLPSLLYQMRCSLVIV